MSKALLQNRALVLVELIFGRPICQKQTVSLVDVSRSPTLCGCSLRLTAEQASPKDWAGDSGIGHHETNRGGHSLAEVMPDPLSCRDRTVYSERNFLVRATFGSVSVVNIACAAWSNFFDESPLITSGSVFVNKTCVKFDTGSRPWKPAKLAQAGQKKP